jgi:uncharacterized lipoprotein
MCHFSKIFKVSFASSLILLLAACSSAPQDRRYVQYAATLPPIQTPSGIKNPTGESYYPVPPVRMTQPLGTEPPVEPPGSNLVKQQNKVPLPVPK